jgi:glycosyltransferase involved in cell wall biosynthesis
MNPRVALVTHTSDGGVWSVTTFLYEVMQQSGRYQPDIILVATSARDPASVRLMSPSSWRHGVQVEARGTGRYAYQHVGALLTEFEFQRYQPRPALTRLLRQYDLVQVVAGSPAWGMVVGRPTAPVSIFAATTVRQERTALISTARGWRRIWLAAMTAITARIEYRALSLMTHVFAESEYTLGLFSEYVEPRRLQLGPPGVDTRLFAPAAAYASDGYVLSVGRFRDPRKNVRLLMDAYSQLKFLTPQPPRLVLVGSSGISPEDMVYAHRLGIADEICVLSDVPLSDLPDIYRGASLFVLASDEEGLGVVILEAMACGLPVISTDCGGPSTAVRHGVTGLLTPVGRAGDLAEAMQSLLVNLDLRRTMGCQARSRVEEDFALETAGRAYLDVYDQLMSNRTAGRSH